MSNRYAGVCKNLPHIDAVLLTHSHNDHLDLPALRILGHSTRIYTPVGHAAWLRRKGFHEVVELGWHESIEPFPALLKS